MEYPEDEHATTEDDVEVFPPDVVPPNGAATGNIAPAAIPETQEYFYSYELDIADTALIWQAGAPIDTGAVRQYLVDRGYTVAGVDAQTDAGGLTTGILTVRTNPVGTSIYPAVAILIEDATESTTTAIVTAATKITPTAIATLPDDVTFSGTVTFGANIWRDVADGAMGIVPVLDGVDQSFVSIAGDDAPMPISVVLDVSAIAGGTAPTFGLKYRGDTTAGTTHISDVVISGTLVDGVNDPADAIDAGEWAVYDGSRYTGIVQTVVTWSDTAEGAITPKPDLPRIADFWRYLEQNDVEVRQITGNWNFTTPDTAPASPTLTVYARGAIDPALTDTYLYSEINQAALDAFTTQWSAVELLTRMNRKIAGQVAVNQYEYSTPYVFDQAGAPTGDVRDGDFWIKTGDPSPYRKRINGEWVAVDAVYPLTGTEQSLAVGRRAVASAASVLAIGTGAEGTAYKATAIGINASADGESSVALGSHAEATASSLSGIAIGGGAIAAGERSMALGSSSSVGVTSPRSIAIGRAAQVPASTPDTAIIRANDARQTRSDGTGRTRYGLQSPDGTLRYLSVTDDNNLLVNDVGHISDLPMVAGILYSTIDRGFGRSEPVGATALVADRLYLSPLFVPHAMTFDQIGVNVTAAVALSRIRLGIFTYDFASATATRVLDAGEINSTTTGLIQAPISQTLGRGWYWLGIASNSTPSIMTVSPAGGFGINTSFVTIASRIKASRTYAAFGATEATDSDSGTTYAVSLRAA